MEGEGVAAQGAGPQQGPVGPEPPLSLLELSKLGASKTPPLLVRLPESSTRVYRHKGEVQSDPDCFIDNMASAAHRRTQDGETKRLLEDVEPQ
jgi:hypothetical protein